MKQESDLDASVPRLLQDNNLEKGRLVGGSKRRLCSHPGGRGVAVQVERSGPMWVLLEEEPVGLAEGWVNSDSGLSIW